MWARNSQQLFYRCPFSPHRQFFIRFGEYFSGYTRYDRYNTLFLLYWVTKIFLYNVRQNFTSLRTCLWKLLCFVSVLQCNFVINSGNLCHERDFCISYSDLREVNHINTQMEILQKCTCLHCIKLFIRQRLTVFLEHLCA